MTDVAFARVFVALGGNVGDRLATLRSATRSLDRGDVPQTWLTQASAIYETRAIGPSEDPFLNAAVELTTALQPSQLLVALAEIEAAHGRVRGEPWQARILDLDIIVWLRRTAGNEASVSVQTGSLVIPHPRARERDFVLQPLAELVSDVPVFGTTTPRQALAALPATDRTILQRRPEALRGTVPHA